MDIGALSGASASYDLRGVVDSASGSSRVRSPGDSKVSESSDGKSIDPAFRAQNGANGSEPSSPPLSTTGDVRSYLGFAPLQKQQQVPDVAVGRKPDAEEGSGSSKPLTEEEQKQVQELQRRDQEVRQHEQAHLAAAGSLATGGAQYQFQTGPDGKAYAIGGQVNIDTSPANTPERTLEKAKQIQRAAMAPADPSPQDVKVAAQAMQMQMEALRDMAGQADEAESDPQQGIVSESLVEPVAQAGMVLGGSASLEQAVMS